MNYITGHYRKESKWLRVLTDNVQSVAGGQATGRGQQMIVRLARNQLLIIVWLQCQVDTRLGAGTMQAIITWV